MEKGLFITPGELTQVLKKRYEKQRNNGKEKDESKLTAKDINEYIAECEVQKFCGLFDKIFCSNKETILYIAEEDVFDSEDGEIVDVLKEIVSRIKRKLEEVDKLKLLKLIFNLLKDLIVKNNGED